METDNIEFTLPQAPRGLCFSRNDFIKNTFSVDNFLAEHQDVVSLETMRDDLGVYLKVLRLAMIDLINKDYANFVNLCATLIGFDKAILKIKKPLGQLNEEVISVKQCLEDAMKELSVWLNQRHALLKKKQLLKYYSQTTNCLYTLDNILKNIDDKKTQEQILLVDRVAMQYNQLKFCIEKCENLLKPEQKALYENIGQKLIHTLNKLLFKFWDDSNEENLLKTLIILNILGQLSETETLMRKKAVAPLLQDIITESHLQKNEKGLSGVYDEVILLLNTKLKLLFTVTEHSKMTFLVKKYRFLVNCFWCEVENRIEVNLSSIFAPGNPQIFYKRYNESMQFLNRFEIFCSNRETVKMLHDTVEYKSFLKRWNLPVYFQIRFQEIAGGFESMLQTNPTPEHNDGFLLKETNKCWLALQECWSDGVYINALAHKFWKLSLQILSRYATWGTSFDAQKSTSFKEPLSLNKSLIDNSINLLIDIETLIQRLPEFSNLVQSKMETELNSKIIATLSTSEKNLRNSKMKIRESIVSELFDFFNVYLKQVSDIPRLYRKTNRSIPSKPCTYIDVIKKTLGEFNENASKRLDGVFLTELYEALFNTMTNSYFKYVEDVLVSVQKTEDSLRRLKQFRENISQQSNDSVGITDGEKIRLQVKVDVVSYGNMAMSLNINVNNVQKYTNLNSMVTEAVKNIDIK